MIRWLKKTVRSRLSDRRPKVIEDWCQQFGIALVTQYHMPFHCGQLAQLAYSSIPNKSCSSLVCSNCGLQLTQVENNLWMLKHRPTVKKVRPNPDQEELHQMAMAYFPYEEQY